MALWERLSWGRGPRGLCKGRANPPVLGWGSFQRFRVEHDFRGRPEESCLHRTSAKATRDSRHGGSPNLVFDPIYLPQVYGDGKLARVRDVDVGDSMRREVGMAVLVVRYLVFPFHECIRSATANESDSRNSLPLIQPHGILNKEKGLVLYQ